MKIRLFLLSAVALTGLLSGCRSTSGQQAIETGTDTIDATLPTQLPRTAIPSHYAVEVTPHADRLAFDGKAAIDLKVIKTTRETFPAMKARLVELHPYEVAEVIALPVEAGHAPYLDWVAAQTQPRKS